MKRCRSYNDIDFSLVYENSSVKSDQSDNQVNSLPETTKKLWKGKVPIVEPPFKLDTLDDLLHIAWNYRGDAFDWFVLWRMIPALTELNNMVGMESIKQGVIDLVVYYLQKLNVNTKRRIQEDSKEDLSDGDMLHTVLIGPPGAGKTTVCHILAKIYCRMGFLSTENIVVAKRNDLVGKYVGHSESKTTSLLKSALGGVFFLDEAYSMGNDGKADGFAKASVDLINQFLSEHKKDFVFIIAGYEKELNESFFAINPGLARRFPWRFHVKEYNSDEMCEIFTRRVSKEGWMLGEDGEVESKKIFHQNLVEFPHYGGDIDNFFTLCKTVHSRRIFGMKDATKRQLSDGDISRAFEIYVQRRKSGVSDMEIPESISHIYM